MVGVSVEGVGELQVNVRCVYSVPYRSFVVTSLVPSRSNPCVVSFGPDTPVDSGEPDSFVTTKPPEECPLDPNTFTSTHLEVRDTCLCWCLSLR